MQLVPLHHENVVACALGHVALVVEHQGFEATGIGALDLGEDVVQVVQRLDARIQRGGVVADGPGGDDLQSVVVQFGG